MKREEALRELNDLISEMSGDDVRKLLDIAKSLQNYNKFEKLSDLNKWVQEKKYPEDFVTTLYAVKIPDNVVMYGVVPPNITYSSSCEDKNDK